MTTTLAALSGPFALWTALLAIAAFMRCHQMCDQYHMWRSLPPERQRALVFLPAIGLLALFCALQRALIILKWSQGHWHLGPTDYQPLLLLPIGLAAAAGCLYWVCGSAFGTETGYRAWRLSMGLGIMLAIGLALVVR